MDADWGELKRLLSSWGKLWGLQDFQNDVSVSFSNRLKTSLGRCRPAESKITLHADLCAGTKAVLAEVLCHEAAHIAAHKLCGPQAAPHGPEWKALVAAAGFEPRIRAKPGIATKSRKTRSGLLEFEHRCPVCQSVRYARRPMPAWRCEDCLALELDGKLNITSTLLSPGDCN